MYKFGSEWRSSTAYNGHTMNQLINKYMYVVMYFVTRHFDFVLFAF